MIFYATKQDFSQVLDLWNESFENEQVFTDYFFNKIYDYKNTLVIKADGKVVSMLQMLPFNSSKGEITYIYGVATAKEYRKMGYADKLLKKSFEISKNLGHKFSILIPAEKSLFDFYKKYDYKPAFFYDTVERKSENVCDISKKLEYSDVLCINQIYDTHKKGDFFIKRDIDFYQKQIDIYGNGALKYIENEKIIGYSFGYYSGDMHIIEEIFSNDMDKCLNSHKNVSCKIYGHETAIGVAKSLLHEPICKDGYLSLMYN